VLVNVSRTGVPFFTVIVAGSNFSRSVALTSTTCTSFAGLLDAGAAAEGPAQAMRRVLINARITRPDA
jgi:hypothetical protein